MTEATYIISAKEMGVDDGMDQTQVLVEVTEKNAKLRGQLSII